MDTAHIIFGAGSALVTTLLGLNIFFIKNFFRRMEDSVSELVKALQKNQEVTTLLSSQIKLLDYQVADLNRIVKNGSDETHSRYDLT